jgi:3-hydroxyisobutyrate dehydrogenase-like beta-hydroxyacid dehydrogenase
VKELRYMALEIGFVGLGAMGAPIAGNLLAAGHHLSVWNRTRAKAEPLAKEGAKVVTNPGDVAQRGGIVISMVSDDAALEDFVLGESELPARLGADGVHVSMSTVAPATIRRLARRHHEAGSAMVSAPVFGRPDAAAARRLVICISGPEPAKQRIKPILEVSAGLFDFGEEPGAANVVKLAGNFLIASVIEAMGEVFTMAEKHGLDRGAVAKMLSSTHFACPAYQNYGPMVAERRHSPAGLRLPLGLKDVELASQAAEEVRVPMPFVSFLRDRLITALANGREELDWSALALAKTRASGMAIEL